MARGKIYPHSLVVADKYSAGYCQVKLDSTAVSIFVYIYIGWNTIFVFVNSTNTSTNTVLANVRCFYLYGQIYINEPKLNHEYISFIHLFWSMNVLAGTWQVFGNPDCENLNMVFFR